MARTVFTDDSYALDGSRRHMQHHKMDERRGYWLGYVITRCGIVGVYAEYGGSAGYYTRLSFVRYGREWSRTFRTRCLSGRALSIAAAKFAQEKAE